jgi:hypothetical protein
MVRKCDFFLDIMIIRKGMTLAINVHRKPTHTGRYLNLISNRSLHLKRGLIQSFHNKASTICQERQVLFNRSSSLRRDLQLSGYPQGFIDSVMCSSHPNEEEKLLGHVYIPYTVELGYNVIKGT